MSLRVVASAVKSTLTAWMGMDGLGVEVVVQRCIGEGFRTIVSRIASHSWLLGIRSMWQVKRSADVSTVWGPSSVAIRRVQPASTGRADRKLDAGEWRVPWLP